MLLRDAQPTLRNRRANRVRRFFIPALTALCITLLLGAMGCSANIRQAGGLELVIATNLRIPDDFDSIQVRIQQQLDDGGWRPPVLDASYAMQPPSDLPTRFAIAAGTSPDQVVLIDVTAQLSGRPIVKSEALIQVPTDRVDEYTVLLTAKCVEVICLEGNTCDPETGMCISNVVDPSQLPPYAPGQTIDAGPLEDVVIPTADSAGLDATVESADTGADSGTARDAGTETDTGAGDDASANGESGIPSDATAQGDAPSEDCSALPDGTSCGPQRSCCGGACVDTQTDSNNCGGCGSKCAISSGATCTAGRTRLR